MTAESLIADAERLLAQARAEMADLADRRALEDFKSRYLGKKGSLSLLLKSLGELDAESRPAVGARLNEVRSALQQAIEDALANLDAVAQQARLAAERIDVTLPGRGIPRGGLHPLSRVESEILSILKKLGFSVARGPEVEDDWHNFEALNFPPDHPSREMQDTFFVLGVRPRVLRTHTSPVQIRVMEAYRPPIRCLMPGKVYRCDSDITHSPVFHQIEGLYVDEGVSFGHLKSTLDYFLKRLYGEKVRMRLRPSFFPFTEPSAEVDISCVFCEGQGCRVCKNSGWIEILGAGLVDPNVFRAVGYDPDRVSGFAFGLGIERIAMLRYGINDIRLFYENDRRFLEQF